MRNALLVTALLLTGCLNSSTSTELKFAPVVLQGHFIGHGVAGAAVTVTQGDVSHTTTTDSTGFYNVPNLVVGPAWIVGVSKDKCCGTGLPTTLHAGVNILDIQVLF